MMRTDSIFCSLDGGGIKGLFIARMLEAMEQDLQTSIVEHFDLIAGTSTGAVIALGLGLGVPMSEIVRLYEEEGPRVFSSNWRLFRSVMGLFRSKYRVDHFERCLRRVFGDRTLGQSTKGLVIPTYNLDEDKPCVLKTPHHPNFRRDHKIPAWQVAVATTAAPTYFPVSANIDGVRHIDGGVWANNPSLVGVIEAHKYIGVPLQAIRLLTIGTGRIVKDRSALLDRGGMLFWLTEGVDVLMHAQSEGIMNEAKILLGSDHVYRVNPLVPSSWKQLDDIKPRDFSSWASQAAKEFAPTFAREFQPHHGRNTDSVLALATDPHGVSKC